MTLNFGNNLFPARNEINNSYSWIDLVTGNGYVTYYACAANSGTYIVVNSQYIKSDMSTVAAYGSTTAYVTLYDHDYDLIYAGNQTVEGNLIVSIPMGIGSRTTSGYTGYVKATVNIYHYDGSTETLLGTATTKEFAAYLTDPTYTSSIGTVSIPITAKKFKKSETLRINILLKRKSSSGTGDFRFGYGLDPANRTDNLYSGTNDMRVIKDNEGTRLAIQVPYKVNI